MFPALLVSLLLLVVPTVAGVSAFDFKKAKSWVTFLNE
jgi:hypothetical protein